MTEQIREAVQMVLTRMETHPEDFYSDDQLTRHTRPRFGWIWNAINGQLDFSYGLNEVELAAIKRGYDGIMYRKFHDRVLESLLNESEEEKMAQQGSSLKASKYVFTQSQAEIAKKLGIHPEEYAEVISKVVK
jgi:hypothetical protein